MLSLENGWRIRVGSFELLADPLLTRTVVEMSRLLTGMLQVVQEVDTNQGVPLCNEQSCPTMSAGRYAHFNSCVMLSLHVLSLTYTWLENGRPARIPAPSYIIRVQKWIVGKIHDPNVFPTDPPTGGASATYASGDVGGIPSNTTPIPMGPTSLNTSLATLSGGDWIGKASGFPQNFHQDCKSIVKQMFRCYAHLYHCHYDNPFWHINRHLELNSCFVHFVTVATYYDLLPKKDMEPLQPLIDIFIKEKVIPPEAVRQHQS